MDDKDNAFGVYLKNLLDSMGVIPRTAAQSIGLSSTHMYNVLHGKRKPTIAFIRQIAEYLQVSDWELMRVAGIIAPTEEVFDDQVIALLSKEPLFGEVVSMLVAMSQLKRTQMLGKIKFALVVDSEPGEDEKQSDVL